MTTPAKRMKVMEAKSFHGLSLLEPEKSSPVIIHAVAAVIPIARSVAGQRSLYPNVDSSKKNPCTVPPVRDAIAMEPKKIIQSV